MKTKVTRKAIKENYKNVICVSYCSLQNLLRYEEPAYYSTRVEGWACDYYVVNENTVISTGYAPTGNIRPSYEVNRKYEIKASEVPYINYEVAKRALQNLIDKYVNEVLENEK